MAKTLAPPPVSVQMVTSNGFMHPTWINWINALFQRVGAQSSDVIDEGSWAPNISGMTTVGNVNVSGRYWKMGDLLQFQIYISTAIGTTQMNAGAKVNNLPFTSASVGVIDAVDTESQMLLGQGSIPSGGKVINLPTWSANPNTIVLTGSVRVS